MTMENQSNPLNPTFKGHVASTLDALVLFEACLLGQLNHVPRRPHDRERQDLIQSGNIFIYEEHASGIKRWTDGVSWSPSRILNNFLVYRELDKPFPPGEKKRALKKNKKPQGVTKTEAPSRPGALLSSAVDPSTASKDSERALIGSLVDSYPFKTNGLVKKTISISFQGVPHHLVSYYSISDVQSGRLTTPSKHHQLRTLMPRGELIMSQSFRAPIDEIEYDERFGIAAPPALFALSINSHEMNHGGLSRAMSLPSFQPIQSSNYTGPPPPPHYGFSHQEDQHQHQHQHHHNHQQQQHMQTNYMPPVTSAAALSYVGHTAEHYALNTTRPPRYPSNSGIAPEFPRNMPSHNSPRRHSATFEAAQQPDMNSMSINSFSEGRSVPSHPSFISQTPYFVQSRPASVAAQGQTFPSPPRQLKAEPDAIGNGDDSVSQSYNFEDQSTNWGFGGMDGPSDQAYYDGQAGDGSQQWSSNPNDVRRV
ncbi:Global transcription regulator sge1 [Cladobotryum mycophilum]|uniref:Global transcription regulator sge1 n=1 Tax=Cladobotryum mycophilum TaxID=491253 RepID=A0ABR0T074_9HYPO